MRSKKSKIITLLGLVLIVGSIIFLVINEKGKKQKKLEAVELENKMKEGIELPGNHSEIELEKVDTLSSDAIGVIRVDKIDIVLPIYGDSDKESLANGVGVVESTDIPTSEINTISVLAGHRGGKNEDQSFLNIDKLDFGDEISITTEDEILLYKVIDQEVIEPTDWSKFVRDKEKAKLFLMSCHPYPKNHKRILIKTELFNSIKK